MYRTKYRVFVIPFVVACLVGTLWQQACAKAPPSLTPVGVTAFQNLQVLKALDVIRDIAVDGNTTVPPVFTTDTTRKVVTWHKAAITTLNARGAGWPQTLAAGLDGVLSGLPAAEKQTLLPYVTLAKTILQEVSKP